VKTKPTLAALVTALLSSSALAEVPCKSDPVGDSLQVLLPVAALGLSAWHDMDTQGMKQFGVTFGVAEGATEVLKYTVHSTRPCGGSHSFPSGHTTSAFSAAAYVQQRYGATESIPFYALAGVTGYERVHTHHHRAGDVLTGAGIGIASSWFFVSPWKPQETNVSMVPIQRGAAIQLSRQW
jgi:membrane-associated phospholipid phosphatase